MSDVMHSYFQLSHCSTVTKRKLQKKKLTDQKIETLHNQLFNIVTRIETLQDV